MVEPLPSYGRGRERPGGRYISFINANGVRDVIITGVKLRFHVSLQLNVNTQILISMAVWNHGAD